MNIRDIKTYFAYLLLIGVLYALTSCQRKEISTPSPEYHPIELAATSDWPELLKSTINGVEDLVGDGFVVWASWAKASDDDALYSGDYASGLTNAVFGINGTKVYAQADNTVKWRYSPQRHWQCGYYNFAAILPASAINAQFASSEVDKIGSAGITGEITTDGILTLSLGKDKDNNTLGLNLASNQVDLMYAYASVDNTELANPNVSLVFHHLTSQISISATNLDNSTDITIQNISVVGPHQSTSGPITLTYSDNGVTPQWTFTELDSETAYKTFTFNASNGKLPKAVDNTATTYKSLVSNLLVFPEQCTLTIKIEYALSTPGSDSTPISGSIDIPVNWQAGQNYNYKLQIKASDITISSSILPWDTTTHNKIENEFN